MRALTVAALVGVLLAVSPLGCAQSKTKMLLTDAQLDGIRAGTDLCVLFGLNGPCVGSLLQVYDPALPPNPPCGTLPGANTNCFSSLSAIPLPQSGSVALQQSFQVDAPFTSQSVSQANTVNNISLQQPTIRSSCFTCWHPMEGMRFPGGW
jgi:hypothetical protein